MQHCPTHWHWHGHKRTERLRFASGLRPVHETPLMLRLEHQLIETNIILHLTASRLKQSHQSCWTPPSKTSSHARGGSSQRLRQSPAIPQSNSAYNTQSMDVSTSESSENLVCGQLDFGFAECAGLRGAWRVRPFWSQATATKPIRKSVAANERYISELRYNTCLDNNLPVRRFSWHGTRIPISRIPIATCCQRTACPGSRSRPGAAFSRACGSGT